MPTNVVDSDVWTTTLQVPNDVTEVANQASLLLFVQGLANRTTYLKNRLGSSARYTPSGAGVATGAKFTLALVERSDTGYSLASDEVQVPAAGWYRISVSALVANSDLTNPLAICARLKVGATTVLDAFGMRFTGSAGDPAACSGSVDVQITTPSTQKITLVNGAAAGTEQIQGGTHALSIDRIPAP